MPLPTDPRAIRERIRRYERKLLERGHYDGSGKRYLLGPLYLMMGDLHGALKSFQWFEQEFSDDGGEPGHRLCWTLALYRAGDLDKATRMLRKVLLLNVYLIPQLLGLTVRRLTICHPSNFSEPNYVEWVPPEFFDLWDEHAKAWAKQTYESEEFKKARARYIEICGELLDLRPGPRRSQLIDELQALEE